MKLAPSNVRTPMVVMDDNAIVLADKAVEAKISTRRAVHTDGGAEGLLTVQAVWCRSGCRGRPAAAVKDSCDVQPDGISEH
jgi:hypothetical protein